MAKRSKKTPDPIIVIVEDDAIWRHELATMYSRILRGETKSKTPDKNYHQNVKTFSTAREAIQYFAPKPGERANSVPKVDILSLDLNLGRGFGGSGLDVLNAAVASGQKFATIAISGFASDDDLHDQLDKKELKKLRSLRLEVESITKARCIVFEKHDPLKFGPPAEQVRHFENDLISQVHGNSNILRTWCAELRNTAADLNGKLICLHFVLPDALFSPCANDWVAAKIVSNNLGSLNMLSVWKNVFEPLDETATQTDLLSRLLFLITGKQNYFSGVSLQRLSSLSEPAPQEEWLYPRQGINVTPREAFLLLQLVAQGWLGKRSKQTVITGDSKDVAFARDELTVPDLMVSGLMNKEKLRLPDGTTWLGNEGSLSVERLHDGKEINAVKQAKHHLNNRLKEILKVDYDLVTTVGPTFELALQGYVYIHRQRN